MIPKKAMQGCPWYQILSNPKYSNLFYYVGAFLEEREKIIEDGFEHTDNKYDEIDKKIKCEQSDMIMILLNLAFIPDEIVLRQDVFDDFKPGWGQRLKQAMKNYQDDFDQNIN